MSAIVIAGDVSGSVTLKAPDNGAATVLTLPAVTDNIVVGNTSINTGIMFVESGGANVSSALTFDKASNNLTLSGTLTYGGVTAANNVTGTGSIVLSTNPTLTGNITTSNLIIQSTSVLTYGGITLANAVTGTGSLVLSTNPTLNGNVTVEKIVANGAAGNINQTLVSNSTGGVYWTSAANPAGTNIYLAANFGGF